MSLKFSPAVTIGGIDYEYFHLRTAVYSAPESNKSPFSIRCTFRMYRLHDDGQGGILLDENGSKVKAFAPLDQGSVLLNIDILDIEEYIGALVGSGKVSDAQELGVAFASTETSYAILLKEQHGITVTIEA